ncbi:hypothetical protein C1645_815937 [Glomus cerebriforme]|uniref:Uncharacterized protein n=1 Tax=Glomus cerebriforme TaxID=658196 RepID=A0A397THX4_9GLOM|nr:hypothetical protein C1645_815937 [Glomus cerebriforme]
MKKANAYYHSLELREKKFFWKEFASKINLKFGMRYSGSTVSKKFQGLLMDNYVKRKEERITRFVSDYIRIYEKNVAARMASNDVAETLVLLSKLGESANVTLRGVDKENKENEKDYRMEQEM